MDQSVSDDNDPSGSVLCRQESVYRVNCMDCLDRTNVTQSVFARDVLQTAVSSSSIYYLDIYLLDLPTCNIYTRVYVNFYIHVFVCSFRSWE